MDIADCSAAVVGCLDFQGDGFGGGFQGGEGDCPLLQVVCCGGFGDVAESYSDFYALVGVAPDGDGFIALDDDAVAVVLKPGWKAPPLLVKRNSKQESPRTSNSTSVLTRKLDLPILASKIGTSNSSAPVNSKTSPP